jgi:hypothetical protein
MSYRLAMIGLNLQCEKLVLRWVAYEELMDAVMPELYQYSSLISNEIRLLNISPGTENATIQGEILHIPLDPRPAYFTLSYTWDDLLVLGPDYKDDRNYLPQQVQVSCQHQSCIRSSIHSLSWPLPDLSGCDLYKSRQSRGTRGAGSTYARYLFRGGGSDYLASRRSRWQRYSHEISDTFLSRSRQAE